VPLTACEGVRRLSEEWHDNRPCDRSDPRYRKLLFLAMIPILALGGTTIYFVHVAAGGSAANALIISGALTGGIAISVASIGYIVESRMPSAITFGPREMEWRTRSEKTLRVPYGSVLSIEPSKWNGDWIEGVCSRYVISLVGRPPVGRWIIWLTPPNKARLEEMLRARPLQSAILPPT
jgi:hypothetical protein